MLTKNVSRKKQYLETKQNDLNQQQKENINRPLKDIKLFMKKEIQIKSQSPIKKLIQKNKQNTKNCIAQFSNTNKQFQQKNEYRKKFKVNSQEFNIENFIQASQSSSKSKKRKIRMFFDKKGSNQQNDNLEFQEYTMQLKKLSHLEHNLFCYYQSIKNKDQFLQGSDLKVILQNFQNNLNINESNNKNLNIDKFIKQSFNVKAITTKNSVFSPKYSFQALKVQSTNNKSLQNKQQLLKKFKVEKKPKYIQTKKTKDTQKKYKSTIEKLDYKIIDLKIYKKINKLTQLQNKGNYKTFEEVGTMTKSFKFNKNKFFSLIKKFILQKLKTCHEVQFDIADFYKYLENQNNIFLNKDFQTQKLIKIYSDYFQKQIIYDQIRKLLANKGTQIEDYFQNAFEVVFSEYVKKYSYKQKESQSSLEDSSKFTITDKSSAISSIQSKFITSLNQKQCCTLEQLKINKNLL